MCGIVGLFLKDPKLEPKLGAMLTDMLITMTDRGPILANLYLDGIWDCLLYTSPSPRDRTRSRMPSSA